MRFHPNLIAAAALLILSAVPAFAKDHDAPLPAAGAGLGFAAIAGGYYAIRRLRDWNAKK